MAPLLNGWRLAERVLLIFAPVLNPNGDHEAFIKAHDVPRERDYELAPKLEPSPSVEFPI